MGQFHDTLTPQHQAFIADQKLFFVATATTESRINLSPKGMDTFRILGPKRAVWLNVTGSGNETSAHVQADGRMTVMFCALEGAPMILRLYGTAKVIHHKDPEWADLMPHLPPRPGARQLFDLAIERIQTSCGTGVPLYTYGGDRNFLDAWAEQKGQAGLQAYWEKKNLYSIDGIPTRVIEKNS